MELSVKNFSDTSIVTQDNCKYVTESVPARYLRKSNHILFKCVVKLCPSKITLSTERDKILTADLQHNHSIGVTAKKSASLKSSTNNNNASPLSKQTPPNPKTCPMSNSTYSSLAKSTTVKERVDLINKSGNSQTPCHPHLRKSLPKSQNNSNKIVSKNKSNVTSKASTNRVLTNTTDASANSKSSSGKPLNANPKSAIDNFPTNITLPNAPATPSLNVNNSSNNNYNVQGTSNTSKTSKKKTKVVIITDSMGRCMRELLTASMPDIEVSASVFPGAKFEQCLGIAEQDCKDLTKQDFVFIMCGTNNTHTLPPNCRARLDLTPLRDIQKRTNIVVSAIPYRHDELSYQNPNIGYTNEYLARQCQDIGVNFLQCNAFIRRRHFTTHGLHLNRSGKRVVCAKLKNFILSLSMSAEVSAETPGTSLMDITCPFDYSESHESTFADFPPIKHKSTYTIVPPVVNLSDSLDDSQTFFLSHTPGPGAS